MNVKAHIRATEDIQNNQTDGGALCDASCSASLISRTHRNAGKVVNGQIYIFEGGTYSAYGAVNQTIISSLESLQRQSTKTSSDE